MPRNPDPLTPTGGESSTTVTEEAPQPSATTERPVFGAEPSMENVDVQVPKEPETETRSVPRYAVGTLVSLAPDDEPEGGDTFPPTRRTWRRYGLVVEATVAPGADEASYVVAWLDTEEGRGYPHSALEAGAGQG